MKKSLFALLLLGLGFFFFCQKASAAADVETEKALIKAVLDNYVTSVEKEDLDLYAKCVAPDADMVNFGAMGEPVVGWEALRKAIEEQNAALSETQINVSDLRIHVSADGKFGWATSLWAFNAKMGENPTSLPVRCSWLLEKREGGWVIVHFHKSVALK